MPELPEIEILAAGLRHALVGRRIVGVDVRERRLREPLAADFAERLRGRRVTGVGRHGKFLVIALGGIEDRPIAPGGGDGPGGPLEWIAHLGMSGSLVIAGPARAPGRHDHVVIRLDDGQHLTFNDPRRFGLMVVRAARGGPPTRLGIDPLAAGFAGPALHALSRRRRRPIKNLLMDQGLVAGLGNIYVNELLFRAGIRPGRAARRLTRAECDALARATREVLTEAIRRRGSSISDFRDENGRPGSFQRRFRVYDREGAPCRRCGRPIRRTVFSGRSAFYCPACQR
jgi:formamidopyrimidine-DNA glycosylase